MAILFAAFHISLSFRSVRLSHVLSTRRDAMLLHVQLYCGCE